MHASLWFEERCVSPIGPIPGAAERKADSIDALFCGMKSVRLRIAFQLSPSLLPSLHPHSPSSSTPAIILQHPN